MMYIHTPEDSTGTFTGFGDDTVPGIPDEEEGYTVIIAGPDKLYGKLGLNQFPTQRLICAIHTWPPGKNHGTHHHPSWEQCYYIIAGQAEITVGNEKRIVGPGSASYMPAKVEHDVAAVGEEMLVAAVIGCVLDMDALVPKVSH